MLHWQVKERFTWPSDCSVEPEYLHIYERTHAVSLKAKLNLVLQDFYDSNEWCGVFQY
jgi:hypothetical protein